MPGSFSSSPELPDVVNIFHIVTHLFHSKSLPCFNFPVSIAKPPPPAIRQLTLIPRSATSWPNRCLPLQLPYIIHGLAPRRPADGTPVDCTLLDMSNSFMTYLHCRLISISSLLKLFHLHLDVCSSPWLLAQFIVICQCIISYLLSTLFSIVNQHLS